MAITLLESIQGAGGYPPSPAQFTVAPSAGDVFFCKVMIDPGQGWPGGTLIVTDSIYNTNWTQATSLYDATSQGGAAGFFFQCPTGSASLPLVTLTMQNASYGVIVIEHYTGFVGTATLDSTIIQQLAKPTNQSSVTFSTITTGYNNEILGICGYTTSYLPSTPSGWTVSGTPNVSPFAFYAIETSSGTTNNFSQTLNASAPYDAVLFGVYDNPSSALTGNSYSVSSLYGSLAGATPGSATGKSYSTSQLYGRLVGSGGLPGNSYSTSFSYGAVFSSTLVYGRVPTPGPGVGPDSRFQFASPILETKLISTLALSGKTLSFSNLWGKASGSGALSGQSDSFSISYGSMQLSSAGGMTGISNSFSTLFGALGGNSFSTISGRSYSFTVSYGAIRAFITVPDVISMTLAAATQLLTSLGFNISDSSVNSTVTPPGSISQQNPIGGSLVTSGTTIQLFVSIGQYVRAPNANLGYNVTVRNFSLEEMVSREWGASFRAPDHRIYVWSNNRSFDSTDIGTTGIYQKGTITS